MSAARSVWGWGLASRFPTREVRAGLGAQLAAILGGWPGEPEVREPRAPALPEPRIGCPLPTASFDPQDRALHTYGRGFPDLVRGFAGDYAPAPDVVLVNMRLI